jgi:hypothetical protein
VAQPADYLRATVISPKTTIATASASPTPASTA